MNGRNSTVPSRATSNGSASRMKTAMTGIAMQADLGPEQADRRRGPQLQVVAVAGQEVAGRVRHGRESIVRRRTQGRQVVLKTGTRPVTIAAMPKLVESVPNVQRGPPADVVDRLAAAVSGTPGVHLLDRTSDASHNRSRPHPGRRGDAVADALEAARCGRDRRDRHGAPIRRAPADRRRRRHPVRAPRRDDDGRLRRLRPGVRGPDRRAVRPAGLPLRPARRPGRTG